MPLQGDRAALRVQELAERSRQCFQCGQCTAACPNGSNLTLGPRRVVRLVLGGDVEGLLACGDVWRCSDCGACSEACPMGVDVAGLMAELRELQLEHGTARCPERRAAEVSSARLARHDRVNALALGVALARSRYLPRDPVNAVATATRLAAGRLRRRAPSPPKGRPFFPGCALAQDARVSHALRELAAALGIPLTDADTGCCGHPSRGKAAPRPATGQYFLTACPACELSLRGAGHPASPIWEVLVEQAWRTGRGLVGAEARFVPYVGCLGDRDRALRTLARAGELAGAEMVRSYPSLHAGCCGALGAVYRGPSPALLRLVAFASEQGAPIVTPCLLCRDNARSAARRHRIRVYYWPEFFRAVGEVASGG